MSHEWKASTSLRWKLIGTGHQAAPDASAPRRGKAGGPRSRDRGSPLGERSQEVAVVQQSDKAEPEKDCKRRTAGKAHSPAAPRKGVQCAETGRALEMACVGDAAVGKGPHRTPRVPSLQHGNRRCKGEGEKPE